MKPRGEGRGRASGAPKAGIAKATGCPPRALASRESLSVGPSVCTHSSDASGRTRPHGPGCPQPHRTPARRPGPPPRTPHLQSHPGAGLGEDARQGAQHQQVGGAGDDARSHGPPCAEGQERVHHEDHEQEEGQLGAKAAGLGTGLGACPAPDHPTRLSCGRPAASHLPRGGHTLNPES